MPDECSDSVAHPFVTSFSLLQLTQTVEQLSETLNDPDETPSTTMLHAVQRHREVLGDYKRDFLQTRVRPYLRFSSIWVAEDGHEAETLEALSDFPLLLDPFLCQTNVQHALNSQNLLGSVRKDIKSVS